MAKEKQRSAAKPKRKDGRAPPRQGDRQALHAFVKKRAPALKELEKH